MAAYIRGIALVATAVFVLWAGPAASQTRQRTTVEGITFDTGPSGTTVVVKLDREPSYGFGSFIDPPALRVDIKDGWPGPGLGKAIGVNDGRVTVIRVERHGARLRVDIGLNGPLHHQYTTLRDPFRIVIEVKGALPRKEEPKEKKAPPQAPGAEAGPYDAAGPAERPLEAPVEAPGAAAISKGDKPVRVGGYAKNETAYRVSEPESLTKVRNVFYLSGTGRLPYGGSYKVSGRAVYDAVYDLTEDYPKTAEEDQRFDKDLRETYIDLSAGDWDLRLGKQFIVWGEAVGLFFADVVNAKDLREFVLPDFDYIRIPQWASVLEYSAEGLHLEAVWIPVLDFNRLGTPGSEFPAAIPAPRGVSFNIAGTVEPESEPENSDVGARASYLLAGWDLSLFYLYAWDRFPVFFRTVASPGLYEFRPAHRRLSTGGVTFSKEIRNVVLKGEFVYMKGKHFSVIDENDTDGVVKKDNLDYLLGVDYTLWESVDVNLQFMQRIIFGHDDSIFMEKRVRNSASLWLKTGFLGNRVEPELLFITDLSRTDMMIRPRLNLRYASGWQFRAGADIFEGGPEGIFGQFDGKDRVYAEARYDF